MEPDGELWKIEQAEQHAVNIVVIGARMSGKSSLIRAFKGGEEFDPRKSFVLHESVKKIIEHDATGR